MNILFATGALLNLAGLVLAISGVFGGPVRADAWIKEKLPSPLLVLALGVVVYIGSIAFDLTFLALSAVIDPTWISSPAFYYEGYLIAFFAAAFVALSVPWLMARAKGGFFSSVGLLVAMGSCAMMLA